ncbi:MAG: MBL fold metallo-hydrolase [Steroidobacteraceae bacterium]
MTTTDRRGFLQASLTGLAALASVPLLGELEGCAQLPGRQPTARAAALPIEKLTDRVSVITGAPGNVLMLSSSDGVLLVDSGSAALAPSVRATLAGANVHTLINTHYHAEQTGGNALFGAAGAIIHSHEITREWLATEYYVPSKDRWVKALPKVARPTVTFRQKADMKVGAENIECGYLLEAHTRGDIYVFFRDSNVLAAGCVSSPLRDPALDWYAGGWIGGRADALANLVRLTNDDTKIVPAYGPVLTRAQLTTERDMFAFLYKQLTDDTDHGESAKDMLNSGVMNEVAQKFHRTFKDPAKFFYDVAKGNWAHYTNFGGNIV